MEHDAKGCCEGACPPPDKPVPPNGYRLLVEGEQIHDDCKAFSDTGWLDTNAFVGGEWTSKKFVPFACKIEHLAKPDLKALRKRLSKFRLTCKTINPMTPTLAVLVRMIEDAGGEIEWVVTGIVREKKA